MNRALGFILEWLWRRTVAVVKRVTNTLLDRLEALMILGLGGLSIFYWEKISIWIRWEEIKTFFERFK